MRTLQVIYEERVIDLASLKSIIRSLHEKQTDNTVINVDISKGKPNTNTLGFVQDSVTIQLQVEREEKIIKDRPVTEFSFWCTTTGILNKDKGKGHETKNDKRGRYLAMKRLAQRNLTRSSQFKGWSHFVAVKALWFLISFLVMRQTGVYGEKELKLRFSEEPRTFPEAEAAKELFVPRNNKEHVQLMNFVKNDSTGKGNNTWYPAVLSKQGVNMNPEFNPRGSAQCRFYDLRARQYETTTCYRPMVAAICIIETGDVPNDVRCESSNALSNTTIAVCSFREAPSFHGAYQTCLGLGGSLWPVAKWPPRLKTKERRRSGLLHYWDSSSYKFLINGSDLTFNVRYSNSLDSTQNCTIIDLQQTCVNSADCNISRFYVIAEEEQLIKDTEKKQVIKQCPSNYGWTAYIILTGVLVAILAALYFLRILKFRPRNEWRRMRGCCGDQNVTTEPENHKLKEEKGALFEENGQTPREQV